MIGCNQITVGKVGNRARQLQDTVESSGRDVELLHGCFQQLLDGGIDVAEVADFGGAHFGVAGQFGAGEALELVFASGLDAGTDGGGVFDLTLVGEFFVVDAGDFDVDVDAVEEAKQLHSLMECPK